MVIEYFVFSLLIKAKKKIIKLLRYMGEFGFYQMIRLYIRTGFRLTDRYLMKANSQCTRW